MPPTYDYKRFAVLYVDDEERSLKVFARAFEGDFRILTAANAREGLRLLEEHPDDIGVLMTDQRMPGEQGTWLLEKARALRPRVLRILVTAFADIEAAVSAVNSGAIYKYIHKPWDPLQLIATLKRGLEFFIVQRERDQLLREKVSILHNVMVADRIISLGLLAAGLSHHIRNSLVAVKTFLDLAPTKLKGENLNLNELRDPDFWRDYYHHVQDQVARINHMLSDLWSAAEGPSDGFHDRIHLAEEIPAVVARLQSEFAARDLRVDCQVPAGLPAMLVDRPKFQRLLELLLKDEIVSLPAGSSITVNARARSGPPPEPAEVEIEVRDNGPGLPGEALRVIFDPFVVRTDSPMEYGINLMAVFFIVHHHGGRIEAVSEPGRGTVFKLTFPVDCAQAPRPEENQQFLEKVILNDRLWEKLIASE